MIRSVKFGFCVLAEIGEGGQNLEKKTNFIITIRYQIPTFSPEGPFFEEGGWGHENFSQKLKFLGFFQLRSPLTTLDLLIPSYFHRLSSRNNPKTLTYSRLHKNATIQG